MTNNNTQKIAFQQIFYTGDEVQRFNISISNHKEELDIWTSDLYAFGRAIGWFHDCDGGCECPILSISYFADGDPFNVNRATVMIDMCPVDDHTYELIKERVLWHKNGGCNIEVSTTPIPR